MLFLRRIGSPYIPGLAVRNWERTVTRKNNPVDLDLGTRREILNRSSGPPPYDILPKPGTQFCQVLLRNDSEMLPAMRVELLARSALVPYGKSLVYCTGFVRTGLEPSEFFPDWGSLNFREFVRTMVPSPIWAQICLDRGYRSKFSSQKLYLGT